MYENFFNPYKPGIVTASFSLSTAFSNKMILPSKECGKYRAIGQWETGSCSCCEWT